MWVDVCATNYHTYNLTTVVSHQQWRKQTAYTSCLEEQVLEFRRVASGASQLLETADCFGARQLRGHGCSCEALKEMLGL